MSITVSVFFTQDVELKVSILEWFATCVETQPGVVEVLLNIDSIHNAASGQKVDCVFTPSFLSQSVTTQFQGVLLNVCVYSFVLLICVCVSPFYVSLSSLVISLTVLGTSITNLNEPPRALATSNIKWVMS